MYNILFGVCALGLGHATRTLPLIRHYAQNNTNNIYIFAEPNILNFFKDEFKNLRNITYLEKEKKYPPLERGSNILAYTSHIIIDGLRMPLIIKSENKIIENIVEKHKIDFVVSDGVYGGYSKKVPSFLLIHQIEFQFFGIARLFRKISNMYNVHIFKQFTKVFIIDYKNNNGLSGKLAHNKYTKSKKLVYTGILSQYKKIKIKQDIDYLVVISGYLHEHKQEFYEKILHSLKQKPGKKVFIMGYYLNDYHNVISKDLEVYSSFKNLDKNKLFNRAKVVISRTGYTTLMDLVELEKEAILIPTPNQSEQLYLGYIHKNKGYFNIILAQNKISEKTLINNKNNTKLIKNKKLAKTKESVEKITKIITKNLKNKNGI
jgi:predicted glycosyltransferase